MWMLPITQPNLWYSSQVASPEVGPSCDLQVYITSNYPYDHKKIKHNYHKLNNLMHNIPVLVGLTTENNGQIKVKTTGTQHRRNYQMTISTCTWVQDALWESFPLPARWNWMNALRTAYPLHCDTSGEEPNNSLEAVIQHTVHHLV